MSLAVWSCLFLVLYSALMLVCGAIGARRVRSGDDFATARGGYGPLFLALAMTATTASGATFLGVPGLAYEFGVSTLWYALLYPVAVYVGVAFCFATISHSGHAWGSRSIPEYMGDRYQSDALRVALALFSLVLLFYLAGQLISGAVMFQKLLGVPGPWAIALTAVVLSIYIALGGAHADILTDGIQGALMVVLSVGVTGMFLIGFGVTGGLPGVWQALQDADPYATACFHPQSKAVASWWDVLCIFVAHLPLGLLPHLGNKIWALHPAASPRRFLGLAFLFGLLLPTIVFGGLLARAVVGDDLLRPVHAADQAIPTLFVTLLPTWLAALLGAGILAAVMSTADGLAVSSSQVLANDLYRRTFASRQLPEAVVDQRALLVSRVVCVAVLVAASGLAWLQLGENIALVVWIGIGGMMAALSGPLVWGVLWRGTTRSGALAGAVVGATVFIVTKSGLISASVTAGWWAGVVHWLSSQSANPFACATLGIASSLLTTAAVSLVTKPLPAEHLDAIFREARDPQT